MSVTRRVLITIATLAIPALDRLLSEGLARLDTPARAGGVPYVRVPGHSRN